MHPVDREKLEMVERYGFCFNAVMTDKTTFVYTAGLHKNFGHPELFVMGYEAPDAANLIGMMVERIKAGDRFAEPKVITDLIDDCPHAVRPMSQESTDECGARGQWLVGDKFPAVQVFFPDHSNLFPWDEGCDERSKRLQTCLLKVTGDPPSVPGNSRRLQ
jgi:hypothetical protein